MFEEPEIVAKWTDECYWVNYVFKWYQVRHHINVRGGGGWCWSNFRVEFKKNES